MNLTTAEATCILDDMDEPYLAEAWRLIRAEYRNVQAQNKKLHALLESMQRDKETFRDFQNFPSCGQDWFVSRVTGQLDRVKQSDAQSKAPNAPANRRSDRSVRVERPVRREGGGQT